MNVDFGPRRYAITFLAVLTCLVACGGHVVIDSEATAMDDAGSPPDASVEPPPPDGDTGGCEDPTACSRIVGHSGCFGPTTVGTFCDFLATPCEATPPDCAKLGGILGLPTMEASCGDGQSFCSVGWVGTMDEARLSSICAAHTAVARPIDCMVD